MEDDLVTSLTRQVKEEVIENYVRERRLVELQVEHLNGRADEVRARAWVVGKRLARLSSLMLCPEMRARLGAILGLEEDCFWSTCFEEKLSRKIPLIRVRALTSSGRFRKLLFESYFRFHKWMKKYREEYRELSEECGAVNRNIESFQKNFDLLSILTFLRTLDMQGIEKKKILGENFTAKEMSELDRSLYIRRISLDKLDAPVPLDLPGPEAVQGRLSALAEEILRLHAKEVREILR